MRTTLRLAGFGLALALTACAGRPPVTEPSSSPAPAVSIEAPTIASTPAGPTPGATATPVTFSFDPSVVESDLAGVDRQLSDINSSIGASDSATGEEGQQP